MLCLQPVQLTPSGQKNQSILFLLLKRSEFCFITFYWIQFTGFLFIYFIFWMIILYMLLILTYFYISIRFIFLYCSFLHQLIFSWMVLEAYHVTTGFLVWYQPLFPASLTHWLSNLGKTSLKNKKVQKWTKVFDLRGREYWLMRNLGQDVCILSVPQHVLWKSNEHKITAI